MRIWNNASGPASSGPSWYRWRIYDLQKNVWIMPFACGKEIKALREFFDLDVKDLRIIETKDLEEDKILKNVFKLRTIASQEP